MTFAAMNVELGDNCVKFFILFWIWNSSTSEFIPILTIFQDVSIFHYCPMMTVVQQKKMDDLTEQSQSEQYYQDVCVR